MNWFGFGSKAKEKVKAPVVSKRSRQAEIFDGAIEHADTQLYEVCERILLRAQAPVPYKSHQDDLNIAFESECTKMQNVLASFGIGDGDLTVARNQLVQCGKMMLPKLREAWDNKTRFELVRFLAKAQLGIAGACEENSGASISLLLKAELDEARKIFGKRGYALDSNFVDNEIMPVLQAFVDQFRPCLKALGAQGYEASNSATDSRTGSVVQKKLKRAKRVPEPEVESEEESEEEEEEEEVVEVRSKKKRRRESEPSPTPKATREAGRRQSTSSVQTTKTAPATKVAKKAPPVKAGKMSLAERNALIKEKLQAAGQTGPVMSEEQKKKLAEQIRIQRAARTPKKR